MTGRVVELANSARALQGQVSQFQQYCKLPSSGIHIHAAAGNAVQHADRGKEGYEKGQVMRLLVLRH